MANVKAQTKQHNPDFKFDIHFIGIDISDAARAVVQKRVERLLQISPHMVRCNVDISSPHRHRASDPVYHVQIRVAVPGGGMKVCHAHPDRERHRDVYVTINDSFDAMEQILNLKKKPRRDHDGIRRQSLGSPA